MLDRDDIDLHASLIGAVTKFGHPIPVYDSGFGPVWVYSEVFGVRGIVREQSYESAYDCVLDEILSPIPKAEILDAYGYYITPDNFYAPTKYYAMCSGEKLTEFDTLKEAETFCFAELDRTCPSLVEGYEYQPNATGTGIVDIDLNVSILEELTPELLARLGITLCIEEE